MTPDDRKSLTTTSYAILGQLAMRPWTMYDLARHMRREVSAFFPRADSQVYAEPKRLSALGLVTSRTEATGRRKRTVYQITHDGRRALSDWLAEPLGRRPQLEFEGLLRVFLSSCGSAEDLERTLDEIHAAAAEARGELAAMRGADGNGGASDLEEEDWTLESRVLVQDFLTGFVELLDTWSARAQERLSSWQDLPDEARKGAALAALRGSPHRH